MEVISVIFNSDERASDTSMIFMRGPGGCACAETSAPSVDVAGVRAFVHTMCVHIQITILSVPANRFIRESLGAHAHARTRPLSNYHSASDGGA